MKLCFRVSSVIINPNLRYEKDRINHWTQTHVFQSGLVLFLCPYGPGRILLRDASIGTVILQKRKLISIMT